MERTNGKRRRCGISSLEFDDDDDDDEGSDGTESVRAMSAFSAGKLCYRDCRHLLGFTFLPRGRHLLNGCGTLPKDGPDSSQQMCKRFYAMSE